MDGDKITAWRHRIPGVHVIEILSSDLDSIEKESLDVGQDFQFGSISFSVFVTLFLTLLLTDIPSPRRYACFFTSTIAAAVFTAYFFKKYFSKRKNFKSAVQTIRDRQVGPLGEEGRELLPTEVARLQVTPAEALATFTADAVLVKAEVAPAPPSGQITAQTGEQQ